MVKPNKCYICDIDNIYTGHIAGLNLGVQCRKCHLTLTVPYEKFYVGNCKTLKEYDRKLLDIAVKIWNKEIKIEDIPLVNMIRCEKCDEWFDINHSKNQKICDYCMEQK